MDCHYQVNTPHFCQSKNPQFVDEEQDVYALQQEMDLARLYLEIEKTRFGDRLCYAIDLEPGVEGQRIPAFSLQPLVENAVKYSVDKQMAAADIQVQALTEGDRIRCPP